MKKKFVIGLIALLSASFIFVSCDSTGGGATYTVTYLGNGNTNGTAPADNNVYGSGDTVTVLGNTGGLKKSGQTFDGWNTAADGNGTSYAVGRTFTIVADTSLYAKWGTAYADVKTSYPKTASTGDYSNVLTVSSALLDNVTGITTITLGGSIPDAVGSSSSWWAAAYPTAGASPASGNYAAFIFDGAFPADAGSRRIAIKNESEALRLYTGAPGLATGPLVSPVASASGNIYIPVTGTPVKWRLYGVGDIPNNDWLSVLLWSGANSKRAVFEIQDFDPSYVPGTPPVEGTNYTVLKKIVIDYSKVTITP
jgi:hypothetical protein